MIHQPLSSTVPSSPRRKKAQTPNSLPRLNKTYAIPRTQRRSPSPNRNIGTKQIEFRDLVDSMFSLATASRDFLSKNNVDIFDSTFSIKFSNLMVAFQCFCQQANNSLGVFQPQNHARVFSKCSQFYKSGEIFMKEFTIYAQAIHAISEEGIIPYRDLIGNDFLIFLRCFEKIRHAIKENMFSGVTLLRSLSVLEKKVRLIEISFQSLFDISNLQNKKFFSKNQMILELKSVARELNNYFQYVLPSDVFSDRKSAEMKYEMINICAEISDLIQSMDRFPSIMSEIKESILKIAKALQDLFDKFHLPFNVDVYFASYQIVSENQLLSENSGNRGCPTPW